MKQVVGDLRRVRQQLAEPGAALAVLGEANTAAATGKLSGREVMPVSRWPLRIESGRSVPCRLVELRLGVEQVHLRRVRRTGTGRSPASPSAEKLRESRDARAGSGDFGAPGAEIAVEERRQGNRPSPMPVRPKNAGGRQHAG